MPDLIQLYLPGLNAYRPSLVQHFINVSTVGFLDLKYIPYHPVGNRMCKLNETEFDNHVLGTLKPEEHRTGIVYYIELLHIPILSTV